MSAYSPDHERTQYLLKIAEDRAAELEATVIALKHEVHTLKANIARETASARKLSGWKD